MGTYLTVRNEDGVNGTVARDFWLQLYFKNWFPRCFWSCRIFVANKVQQCADIDKFPYLSQRHRWSQKRNIYIFQNYFNKWTFNKLANFLKSLLVSKTPASAIRLRSCLLKKTFATLPYPFPELIWTLSSSCFLFKGFRFLEHELLEGIVSREEIFMKWIHRWDYLDLTFCSLQSTVSTWFIPFT